ncbi:GNAT family N-acetyltransferase [Bdellovibrionota bacterium FG-2]
MWVAKPFSRLSPSELASWSGVLEHRAGLGEDVPLAQTPEWCRAIDSSGGASFIVFDADRYVGGTLFASPGENDSICFECTNGPLLDWSSKEELPAQIGMFSLACSKLHSRFGNVQMRPRWRVERFSETIVNVPIECVQTHQAATLLLSLGSELKTKKRFTPRLQRTLRKTLETQPELRFVPMNQDKLDSFVPRMRSFGQEHGFYVPELPWFKGLLQTTESLQSPNTTFWLSQALWPSGPWQEACASLLIAVFRGHAHYLFGYDLKPSSMPSSLSPASAAHWKAICECIRLGCTTYDLNGYVENVDPSHAYAGVCKFKEQFGADLLKYVSPEFIVERD